MFTLRITPLPVVRENSISESSDHGTGEACKLTHLNVSICGVLGEGDIDRYAVDLLESQTLSVEVDAVRLGDRLLDTVLSIKNPAGEVIVSVDDGSLFQQDSTTAIIASETGQYIIEIHPGLEPFALFSQVAISPSIDDYYSFASFVSQVGYKQPNTRER